jgi:probable addiction module antidote protein
MALKTVPFDASKYLGDDESVAHYLTSVLEENDPGLLAEALGDVARARGMAEIARAAGLSREALYKAHRRDSNPRFDTISRVLTALGVKMTLQTAK